jgi:carbon-monoxide dehydrogenase medium subunit
MKPVAFDYARASSVDEALAMLEDAGAQGRVLAGGQTLGPMLNMRLAMPALLVDIGGIAVLRETGHGDGTLRIGACVTHSRLEDDDDTSPERRLLSHVASTIAFRAIRNRGTVGGSLSHADPAADWPLVMTLLDARITIASRGGAREVAMRDFMQGAYTTALGAGELLQHIEMPRLDRGARWGYHKISRKLGEFPEASAGALVDAKGPGVRIVVGALQGAPALLPEAAARIARDGAQAATHDALERELHELAPELDDVDLHLHAVAARRAILQAFA